MIVYIVTSGRSTVGPRTINGVFSNREQAENFYAVCEGACLDDPLRIEEWDTDGVHIDCKREVKAEWTINVKPDGVVSYISKSYTFRDADSVSGEESDMDGWFITKTLPRNVSEDEAVKILLERLERYKNSK